METRRRTRAEDAGPHPTTATDTPPKAEPKLASTQDMLELVKMMTEQQNRVIASTQESMANLLRELKRGRQDQVELDNVEQARLAEEKAERERVQRDLEERQLTLREEELQVAKLAEERRGAQQEEELRLRRQELEAQRQREERMEEQRQVDLQRRREELRERKREEEKRARLKAIQLPPPMSNRADLVEYLQLFEKTVRRKELPQVDWAPTLAPLLNEKYRGVTAKLPPDVQDDFDALKEALQGHDDLHTRNASSTFWTTPKKKGTSAIEYHQTLTRLLHRFAEGDDKDSLLDSIVRERLIQEMPKEGRAYVRQRKPRTGLEAATLAEEWFQLREEMYSGWTSEQTDQKNSGQYSKDKHRSRRWRDHTPRQQGRDTPGRVEEATEMDPQPSGGNPAEARKKEPQQSTGGGRGPPGGGFKCFQCGEKGHRKANCPNKPAKINKVETTPETRLICQLCGGEGHGAKDCSSRVGRLGVPLAVVGSWNSLRAGEVEDRRADNILLDSGAQVSIVARQALPTDHKTCGTTSFKPLASPVIKCPATVVKVRLGEHHFQVRAAILDKQQLGHDLLLGDNIPGIKLQDLMTQTRPPLGAGNDVIPQSAVAPEDTQANRRTQRQQMETPSGAGNQNTPQPAVAPEERPTRDQESVTEGHNGLHLVNVVTRAQTRRTAQQERADEEATWKAEAEITAWTDIQPLEEEESREQTPQERETATLLAEGRDSFRERQRRDPTLETVFRKVRPEGPFVLREGVLHRSTIDRLGRPTLLVVVPEELRKAVYEEAHDNPLAGHFSHKKTKQKIERTFFWPGMSRDVKKWSRACHVCQCGNGTKPPKSPLVVVPVIAQPWRRLAFDIVGPLPRSKSGHRYLLTCIDMASRYPEALPLRWVDAESVADGMLEVFSKFGIPEELLSDNGSAFKARLMETLLRKLGVKQMSISPYHPESNGALERWHRTLKTVIAKLDSPKKWTKVLPLTLFACRDSPHSATGLTPFEVFFGWDVRGPMSILKERWTSAKKLPTNVVEYLQKVRRTLDMAKGVVDKMDSEAKAKSKSHYDRSARDDPLQEGDEVLLLHPEGPKGWKASWAGPYVVEQVLSPVTYKISTPGKRGAVMHRNHLRQYVRTAHINHVVLADAELDGQGQLELAPTPAERRVAVSPEAEEALKTLDETQRSQLDALLKEFEDTFSTTPGKTDAAIMEIDTGNSKPSNVHPYRVLVRWKDKLDEEIRQLLDLEIIRLSRSAWSSPVVCVAKPNGDIRLCVDFRALNAITTTDVYPMPRVEELLDEVAPARFISTLDLCKGYYQIPLMEKAISKTAFVTPSGKYEFLRVPFGLKNAPSTFQRMMDNVLAGVESSRAYIDDVVIRSATWDEHLVHLRQTLEAIKKASLKVKPGKCVFAKASVSFLGHRLGHGEIHPQETKVQALREYPRPVTKRDLRAFLGLAGYYRRFIHNFAMWSSNLTDATSKTQPEHLCWTAEMEREFTHLKGALTAESTLTAFHPERDTRIHTDASDRGIGAVLVQVDEEGEERPVAYFSRKLLPRETRYSVSEKECLAVVSAVRHFEAYLLGAEFQIVTDHKALLALGKTTSGGARITRWALALQPFAFTISHKPGKHHNDADGLSRQAWAQPDDKGAGDFPDKSQQEGEVLGPGLAPGQTLWTRLFA